MQKQRLKHDVNPVGVAPQGDPHFEGTTKSQQRNNFDSPNNNNNSNVNISSCNSNSSIKRRTI